MEPHFDATPAVEKALAWVQGLGERSFVGTESRLNTIFELLRQIVYGTETNPGLPHRQTCSADGWNSTTRSAASKLVR